MLNRKPWTEKQTAFRTKAVALIFGFAFLGLAFLAQFLGGVLQAALTVFGVVGGPLLGFFSLGMFTVTANQKVQITFCSNKLLILLASVLKGALTGLATGLSMALWMGFGQPRPSAVKLPVTTAGCNFTETTTLNATIISTSANEET